MDQYDFSVHLAGRKLAYQSESSKCHCQLLYSLLCTMFSLPNLLATTVGPFRTLRTHPWLELISVYGNEKRNTLTKNSTQPRSTHLTSDEMKSYELQ